MTPARTSPRAIIYMILASTCFALMGLAVKYAEGISMFQKVLFRNLVILFIIVPPMLKRGPLARGEGLTRAGRWRIFLGERGNRKYLLLRSCFGFGGVVLYFYAIMRMSLADSSMLNHLSPFFVTIFAVVFLKDRLAPYQIPALLAAFAGALFIIKPRFDFSVLPALVGVASAVSAGAAYTVLNFLGGREDSATPIFWFSSLSTLVSLPIALAFWKSPDTAEWLALLATGAAAAGGQYFVTLAYQHAPAGEISIFDYTNILISGLLGWLVFGEIPDRWSALGGVIIIAVALFLFIKTKRRAKAGGDS